jgi:hypothetical protein
MRSASNASLSVWTPQGSDKAHWRIHININDSAVGGTAQITHPVDLGSVEPDLGKWTDFVIRLRVNPFKTTTNPAKEGIQDSKDRSYEGNKGVMQLWKAEGVNRDMILKIDKVNTPVGYVPHATRPIEVSFRVYKYGWRNNPTTVEGPIWVGFDEMRYGATVRHGTRYEDVLPSNGPEIQQAPRPPSIVVQ